LLAPNGTMRVQMPAGEHLVAFTFGETNLRLLADSITLIAFVVIIGLIWKRRQTADERRTMKDERASSVVRLPSPVAVSLALIAFYFVGGLAALALQVVIAPNSTAPTIGASGAIAAVLGGYILLYPRARVLTLVLIVLFFTVIELPAVVMLGIWFAEQALFGASNLTNPTGGGGGVAYFAHVGGFAFGLAAVKLLATRVKRVPPRIPVY